MIITNIETKSATVCFGDKLDVITYNNSKNRFFCFNSVYCNDFQLVRL